MKGCQKLFSLSFFSYMRNSARQDISLSLSVVSSSAGEGTGEGWLGVRYYRHR